MESNNNYFTMVTIDWHLGACNALHTSSHLITHSLMKVFNG